jgi:cardiolipin synthase
MLPRKDKSIQTYSNHNSVKLIRGGKAYFELLLDLINRAQTSIHLQSYIYENDETGRLIANALKAASERKVDVYLLADGYASRDIPQSFIDDLTASGIHFRFFEPLLKSKHFYFGRRMHHKIAVADARFSLVGGVNISNRYNDMPGQPAWLDFIVFSEGDISYDLCVLCWKTWNGFPVRIDPVLCKKTTYDPEPSDFPNTMVRMRRNDWLRGKTEISASYKEMFRNARSEITILCSYFLPGKVMRRSLKAAAKRGIMIRVIAAGHSDVMVAKQAEKWLYDWLLRNNINLYEYQPAVLHAKIAVCDKEWVTIGSYNINDLSAYTSIELNLDIRNQAFGGMVTQTLENIIEHDCLPITREEHIRTKNIFLQFSRWCSYYIIRILYKLVTFYYKRMN